MTRNDICTICGHGISWHGRAYNGAPECRPCSEDPARPPGRRFHTFLGSLTADGAIREWRNALDGVVVPRLAHPGPDIWWVECARVISVLEAQHHRLTAPPWWKGLGGHQFP